jgi:mannose-6-phosphate isomerase
MERLYPLLMQPRFDPRPWGTLDLAPIYPNHRFTEKIGESWLSGDESKVANGPLAGRSLAELAREYSRDLVGEAAAEGTRFPLLLKFLFPHDKLSVQVHPDDDRAKLDGFPSGKTECWWVAHAQPGAQIALGMKPGVTRSQLEQAIHDQRAEDLLNWVRVFAGDMIYVAGGTVHTLGPGSVIVETQQQSDTTYRLYDYGRPRELHLAKGLAAVKEQPHSGKVAPLAAVALNGSGSSRTRLIASPFFQVDKYELQSEQELQTVNDAGVTSAHILVAVEGCAQVESAAAGAVTMAKGDAVVIPAAVRDYRVRPQWSTRFLMASVPSASTTEPQVTL